MLKKMRPKYRPSLVVDAGNFMPRGLADRKIRADITVRAMAMMGYGAINLGPVDFSLGLRYLTEKAQELSLPLVTSNLVFGSPPNLAIKRSLVVDSDGIRVGILGIAPISFLEKSGQHPGLAGIRAEPPGQALAELLPKLKDKTDIILLLSQLSQEETLNLVKRFSAIDIAIVAARTSNCDTRTKTVNSSYILTAGYKGKKLGRVTLDIQTGKPLKVVDSELIGLGDSVIMDPEINKMIIDAFRRRKRQANRKRQEELKKKLMDNLKMSPEEFFEKLQKGETK